MHIDSQTLLITTTDIKVMIVLFSKWPKRPHLPLMIAIGFQGM